MTSNLTCGKIDIETTPDTEIAIQTGAEEVLDALKVNYAYIENSPDGKLIKVVMDMLTLGELPEGYLFSHEGCLVAKIKNCAERDLVRVLTTEELIYLNRASEFMNRETKVHPITPMP